MVAELEGSGSSVFFFSKSYEHRDVKEICITLVRCNQIYLMGCILNGKIFRIDVYIFVELKWLSESCMICFYRWLFGIDMTCLFGVMISISGWLVAYRVIWQVLHCCF